MIKAEFEKALKWAKETCKIGWDKNPEELQVTPERRKKSSLSSLLRWQLSSKTL